MRCSIDTTEGQPNSYEIKVNGERVRVGNIATGEVSISETITLDNTSIVECLIKGPKNTNYIDSNCSKTVVPIEEPMGNCLQGDNTTNATICRRDNYGSDANVSEKLVPTCSDSRKCEYTCNDGFVEFNGTCIEAAEYGEMTVPSHIRPGVDYPLVMCQ